MLNVPIYPVLFTGRSSSASTSSRSVMMRFSGTELSMRLTHRQTKVHVPESSHRKPPGARRPAGLGGHHTSLLRTPDYRVHLPLGILTGPGWKNFSGVITPSFLNTIPFFITNCTLRNASISVSGSPATAIRSA